MRIATYNTEWFTSLFDDQNQLLEDDGWSARYKVTRAQQIGALGTVFQAMDADAVMVIEAPDTSKSRSTVQALETFAARFDLRTTHAALGFSHATQQEIALLYDPQKLTVRHDPKGPFAGPDGAAGAPRCDSA